MSYLIESLLSAIVVVHVVLCHLGSQALYRNAIGFKAKRDISWEARPMYNGKWRNSTSVDKWQYQSSPPPQFWFVSFGEGNFFTHGKLQKTDHGTFGATGFSSACTACTWWVFGFEPESSGPKPYAIPTSLPMAYSTIIHVNSHILSKLGCIYLISTNKWIIYAR